MSLSYGFYNSLDYDRRYNSMQISRIFDGIISDGVYQHVGSGMMVEGVNISYEGINEPTAEIKAGRAWFNHTWTYNDSVYMMGPMNTPLAGNQYIAVVLEVNLNERTNSFKYVEGEQAENPTKPVLIKDNGIYQYPLAYIYRTRNVWEIEPSDIENTVGTEECPFVSAPVLGGVTVDDLMTQWTAEYEQWTEEEKSVFQTKLDELQAQLIGFEGQLEDQVTAWFNNLQTIIDENAAIKLQNEIGNLEDLKTENKSNLVSAINENQFVGAKWNEGFRPIIYCGLEITGPESARLRIPKLIHIDNAVIPPSTEPSEYDSDEYLQLGDVLYCRIVRAASGVTKCQPKSLEIFDKNENQVFIEGTFRYLSSKYIRYDKTGVYAPLTSKADPPYIYDITAGTVGLNATSGFTFLVYRGVVTKGLGSNTDVVFSDVVNDSYSIEDRAVQGFLETKLDANALASVSAVRKAYNNSLIHHVLFSGGFGAIFDADGNLLDHSANLDISLDQQSVLASYLIVMEVVNAKTRAFQGQLLKMVTATFLSTGIWSVNQVNAAINPSSGFLVTFTNVNSGEGAPGLSLTMSEANSKIYEVNVKVYWI